MNRIADTLREARRRIEDPGKWGQGPLTDGLKCIVIACDGDLKGIAIAFTLLREAAGVPGQSIAAWNDAPERTHADVLAAFDRAIALAESAEEKT